VKKKLEENLSRLVSCLIYSRKLVNISLTKNRGIIKGASFDIEDLFQPPLSILMQQVWGWNCLNKVERYL